MAPRVSSGSFPPRPKGGSYEPGRHVTTRVRQAVTLGSAALSLRPRGSRSRALRDVTVVSPSIQEGARAIPVGTRLRAGRAEPRWRVPKARRQAPGPEA